MTISNSVFHVPINTTSCRNKISELFDIWVCGVYKIDYNLLLFNTINTMMIHFTVMKKKQKNNIYSLFKQIPNK